MTIAARTQNIRKGISDKETVMLCTLAHDYKSIIGYDEIIAVARTTYQNARKIAERLCKKKWLIRIASGRYLIAPLEAGIHSKYTLPGLVIASALAAKRPYYIAYSTALNYYGYTEQFPFTVHVATTSRIPRTVVHGGRYKFFTISKTKFFGIKKRFIANETFAISDKDKTIADALDHPEYCGGMDEVAKCLWNAKDEISLETIISYAKRMQNRTIIKRLGYLADLLEIEIPSSTYNRMRDLISSGYSLLSPSFSKRGSYNSKWNLLINATPDIILAEAKSET